MIKTINPETLKEWLTSDNIVLIDVREPSEYNIESINQSQLIPLGEISLAKLPSDAKKGKRIVMQCRSGKRSEAAAIKLLAEDATLDIYNLEGGILGWVAKGFETKKSV